MMDLRTYGYIETEAIPDGWLPGRITEIQRERFTVMTEQGEVTAVLKGSFYHHTALRAEFPCVGDFVLLHYSDAGDSLIVKVLPRRSSSRVQIMRVTLPVMPKRSWSRLLHPILIQSLSCLH